MEENTGVMKIEESKNSPAEMIRMAVTGGADLEKLEKLLALQERWDANEARKAYHVAMSEFKANPPKIEKDRTVSFNQTKYNYASLANVTDKINEALSKHGLSASWITKTNGVISVTCRITHVQGHSEETTLTADADKTGAKNNIQAMGSTLSYLQRYSLLALTGLATYEQDDDSRSAGGIVEYIDEKQQGQILDYINEIGSDKLPKFLEYMKITKLEEMPKSSFQKAISALEAALRKAKK